MSYTPTVWNTGDIVSSQKLNKLEEGVEGAYEVMVINDNNGTLDKTWQEIHDAMVSGIPCVVISNSGESIKAVQAVEGTTGAYFVSTQDVYTSNESNGFPALSSLPEDG